MNFSNGGGTERVTSVIANNLIKRDYEVSIISCQHGEKCKFKLDEKIKLLSIHGEKQKNPVLRKAKTYTELNKIVKENNIDILIAVDVALYLYLIPLQLTKKCKCLAWEHFNYYIANNKMISCARKLAAKYSDGVIVLGKNDLENYKKHYKKIRKIDYIYNPIALNLETTASMKEKRVIAVGRLSKQKGFDLLIEAWAKIEKDFPDWKLDIFGDGEMKDELQNQINENNLNNIKLRGYATDIEQEYLNSSIFALSSRYEGFVLVLMEALAKGLPSVSFNCKEGPAETIDDGVNGFLVEMGNVDLFAEKLAYLMKNEDIRYEFSKNARKDLYRFDITEIMDKWETILQKC